jgi:hypothetical protein
MAAAALLTITPDTRAVPATTYARVGAAGAPRAWASPSGCLIWALATAAG